MLKEERVCVKGRASRVGVIPSFPNIVSLIWKIRPVLTFNLIQKRFCKVRLSVTGTRHPTCAGIEIGCQRLKGMQRPGRQLSARP